MRKIPTTFGLLLTGFLCACTTPPTDQDPGTTSIDNSPRLTAKAQSSSFASSPEVSIANTAKPPLIVPGTGTFINEKALAKSAPITHTPAGEVTLNFEGADVRDVAKVIFDTLKENYTVDSQVQGEVTVQTTQPLAREQLLPTLETILRMANAVLVRDRGLYRIIPAAGATQKAGVTPRLFGGRTGYGVRIVPLRYASAAEMQTIIAPFLPEGGILRADKARNLLILAGTAQELANVQATIDTFDVNWLKGMSIGMFRLRNIDSQAMATNLNQLLGEGSGTPIAGLLRFVPLSKLNAVLVVTPQPEYLKEVALWIERLDGVGGERLYTYQVQNSRADYVAELLNGLFNLGGGGGSGRGGELAPGLKSGQLSSGGGAAYDNASLGGASSGLGTSSLSSLGVGGTSSQSGLSSSGGSASLGGASSLGGSSSLGSSTRGASSNLSSGRRSSGGTGIGGNILGSGGPSAGMEEVRIVADTENNSLLIWATNQNYERIIGTLQKLDVTPRQVLIEATIAEVTLTGNLQYGLQWFFENEAGSNNGKDYTGTGSLGLGSDSLQKSSLSGTIPVVLPATTDGFSYVLTNSGGLVRALLKTLANDSKVKVLSSPQVMVVDNQKALIRVGTQQPIPAGTTTTNNVTTSGGVEYKDTGVLLEVLPRVNSGGMVNMEVKQEVVDVGPIDTATRQRSFAQRSINSKVSVQSGETLVLGGLIRDNRSESQGGIPVLYKIPVVGALFGSTTQVLDRTELVVLITPRVVQNTEEANQVTDEIRRKMRELAPLIPAS